MKRLSKVEVRAKRVFADQLVLAAQEIRDAVRECNAIVAEFEEWQQSMAGEMGSDFSERPESCQENPMNRRVAQVKSLMGLAKRLGLRDTLRLLTVLWGEDAVQAELDRIHAESCPINPTTGQNP